MEKIDYEKLLQENLTEGAFAMITKSEKDFADWINRIKYQAKRCDELFTELKAYQDAEEQGLLLKPKVALGSFVYLDSVYWGVIPYEVCNISYSIHGFCYVICAFKGDELLDDQEVVDDDFGKFVFLTKEEAEKIKENEHGKS